MEPVAAAAMVMIGAVLATAAVIGAIGGVIAGSLKWDLVWGALATLGVYLAGAPLLTPMISSVIGLPLLALTYVAASVTTHELRTKARLHPVLAALVGFVSAVGVAFLHATLVRSGALEFVDSRTSWIGAGAALWLVVIAVGNRRRTLR